MEAFISIGEAVDAIVAFDRSKFTTMPEPVQEEMNRLAGVGISPADRIVRTAEILFAYRAKLTRNDHKEMVAKLITFAALQGWHGLNVENRAGRIAAVMLAEAGGPPADGVDVPAPYPEFNPVRDRATTPAPAPAPTPST